MASLVVPEKEPTSMLPLFDEVQRVLSVLADKFQPRANTIPYQHLCHGKNTRILHFQEFWYKKYTGTTVALA